MIGFAPLQGKQPVADIGGARDVHPSSSQFFKILMQFSGKNWPNKRLSPPQGLAPHWKILDPPLQATFADENYQ